MKYEAAGHNGHRRTLDWPYNMYFLSVSARGSHVPEPNMILSINNLYINTRHELESLSIVLLFFNFLSQIFHFAMG